MPNHFIEKYKKDKKFLEENHVYNEQDEHSSCGVGLIVPTLTCERPGHTDPVR